MLCSLGGQGGLPSVSNDSSPHAACLGPATPALSRATPCGTPLRHPLGFQTHTPGSPGLGPMSMRKELVVFKSSFHTRNYCLSECTQVSCWGVR